MTHTCFVRICLVFTLAVPLAAQFDAAAVIQYTAEPISIGMTAAAMNNRGWIVGYDGAAHPARYRPGIGVERISEIRGELLDINDAGTAVGYVRDDSGRNEAIIRPTGAPWKWLGHLGGNYSEALAINEAGQVVGWSLNASGRERPFIYTEATGMQMLFNHTGRAIAINEAGQVTGEYRLSSSGRSAFLWDPVAGLINIEAWPGVDTDFFAYGIADNGTVAGLTRQGLATFSLASGLRRIGGLTGISGLRPAGVNDRGWIVGCDPCEANERPLPWLYVYGQGTRDLNSLLTAPLPQPLTHAIDINDRDEILALVQTVGYYILKRVRE